MCQLTIQCGALLPLLILSVSGDPNDPRSLHHIDPYGQQINQYQAAITAVGEVIQFYDTDQKYPVYGFGGQFRDGKQ